MVIHESIYSHFCILYKSTGLLIDNEIYTAAPVVTFDFVDTIVEEGETVEFMLLLDKLPDREVTVMLTTSDASAGGYLCVANMVVYKHQY